MSRAEQLKSWPDFPWHKFRTKDDKLSGEHFLVMRMSDEEHFLISNTATARRLTGFHLTSLVRNWAVKDVEAAGISRPCAGGV
eukprot:jgi/Tetstr1/457620/TSEL_044187.t1